MCTFKKAHEVAWFKKLVKIAVEEADENIGLVADILKRMYVRYETPLFCFETDDLFEKVCIGVEQGDVRNEKFFTGKVAAKIIEYNLNLIDEAVITRFANRLQKKEINLAAEFRTFQAETQKIQ